jgi:hypothetical protein
MQKIRRSNLLIIEYEKGHIPGNAAVANCGMNPESTLSEVADGLPVLAGETTVVAVAVPGVFVVCTFVAPPPVIVAILQRGGVVVLTLVFFSEDGGHPVFPLVNPRLGLIDRALVHVDHRHAECRPEVFFSLKAGDFIHGDEITVVIETEVSAITIFAVHLVQQIERQRVTGFEHIGRVAVTEVTEMIEGSSHRNLLFHGWGGTKQLIS